jgi:hypothetical protein
MNETACTPTAWLALALLIAAVAVAFLTWRAMRSPTYAHMLDTVRLQWVENHGAQLVPHNDTWGVLIDGKVVASGSTLGEAIDTARL